MSTLPPGLRGSGSVRTATNNSPPRTLRESWAKPSKSRLAISRFAFEMGDPRYLDHVLNQVRRIDGVYDVYRTSGNRPVAEAPSR